MRRRVEVRPDEVPAVVAAGPCVEVWASPAELAQGGTAAELGAFRAWVLAKHEWAGTQPDRAAALRRVGHRAPYWRSVTRDARRV